MNLRWFLSSTVRQAMDAHKHVRKLLAAQRDILPQASVDALEATLAQTREVIDSNPDDETLKKQVTILEEAANKYLKPYPNPEWRENIEVFLVAIAVAMAIRTFFLQPFKIPTGSMQPTLFGVTMHNLKGNPEVASPNGWHKFVDGSIYGTFYHRFVAPDDVRVEHIYPPEKRLGFINVRRIQLSNRAEPYTMWFMPDDDPSHVFEIYADVHEGQEYKKGQDIFNFKEITGDHLFVDRMTYNFRRPTRGDIIVFETKNIPGLPPDQFYIKRLVGLGGEAISIGADRHVRIDGKRLDASTPHFENVYSFTNKEGHDSEYSGHTLINFGPFSQPDNPFRIRPKSFFAMGDNTVSSFDSRYWGEVPQENVIGKPCFIYWPVSPRFGWGYN